MKKISVSILTLCVFMLLVCAASASVLSIENGQVAAIGSTASVNIVLDEATAGLSGYSINVSVENPGVATISSVTYPSWASLTQTSALPSSECRIKASDTGEQVQSGATNVPMATVTLQGLAGGSTAINLVVNMMNDDSDATMAPTISAGTFTVDVPIVTPVADFTATPTSGDLPLTVAFTDQSTNAPTSWAWDFGNGATSTDKNPSHQYTTAGIFTVTLTATNAAGSDSEEKTGFITVIPDPPIANFAKNVSAGQAPLSVQFTDTSTGGIPSSWAWDFQNDGYIDSNEENPVFVYTIPGTYSINLTVANLGGSNSRLKTNQITVTAPAAPTAAFTSDVQSGTAPLTVAFTDQSTNSPSSWAWTFGDGGTSDQQNPSHQYTATGSYTVKLTATNDGGSDDEEKIGYITVTSTPVAPVAAFTSDVQSGTAPLTVNFTDQSTNGPASWAWTFGDGGTSDQQNPGHQYTTPGTYTVKLTATNAGGSDDEEKIGYITASAVTVAPVAAFTSDVQSGTAPLTVNFTDQSTNGPASWAWTFGDGGTSDQQNPSHQYTAAGNYTVKLTATNAAGSNSEEKTDYINVSAAPVVAPIADFTVSPNTPTTGVVPLFVRFTDISTNSPTEWLWDFGDGGTSIEQNATHTYMAEGTYTVTLTATNAGGSDSEVKSGLVTVSVGTGGLAKSAWPTVGHDILHTFQSPYLASQTGTPKWIYPTGNPFSDDVAYSNTPVIGPDGTIYTTDFQTTLSAINPDGTTKWQDPIQSIGAVVLGSDGILYSGDRWDGYLYAVYASNGTIKWKSSVPGSTNVIGIPVIGQDGTIYIPSYNRADLWSGVLCAFSPDGTLKWSYSIGLANNKMPAIDREGTIYIIGYTKSLESDTLYAFNPDGTLKWSNSTPGGSYGSPTVGVDGTTIYYTNYEGNVYAVDSSNGARRWQYSTGVNLYCSPAIDKDGTIYIAGGAESSSANAVLFALNPDGTLKRTFTLTGFVVKGGPVIGADGTIYISDDWPGAYGINPDDGTLKWSYLDLTDWNNDNFKGSAAIGSDGTVYFINHNSRIYAFPGVVNFTADKRTGGAPLTVQFTGTSSLTVVSWSWDFGDSTTSTEQNPSHTYTSVGNFTVNLTITHDKGTNSYVHSEYIATSATPIANFTATPLTGTDPLVVQFTDISVGNPTSWSWDFGDGSNSTEQNPLHIFDSPGIYTVNLTATNAGGSNTVVKNDLIMVTASGALNRFKNPGFETGDLTSWTGESATSVTSTNPHSGSYAAFFNYAGGSGNQFVYQYVNLTGITEISFWGFQDGSMDSTTYPQYFQTSIDGTLVQTDNCAHAWTKYTVPVSGYTGVHLVQVAFNPNSIGQSAYVDDFVAESNIAAPPVAAFTSDVQSGSAPLTVNFTDQSTNTPTSWLWTFGDGATSTDQNPQHTYQTTGTYTVNLTVTNSGGTSTHIEEDYIVVSGDVSTRITNPGFETGDTTGWQVSSGDDVYVTSASVHSGSYCLYLNYGTGSYASQTIDLTGVSSVSFWNNGKNSQYFRTYIDGELVQQDTAIKAWNQCTVPVSNYTGLHELKIEFDYNNKPYGGYIDDFSLEAEVDAPIADFNAVPVSGTAPLTVNFTDTSTNTPTSWSWDFGDGGTSDQQNPSHQYTAAGTYTVKLTATNGGGSDDEEKTGYITVTAPPAPVAAFISDVQSGVAPLTVTFTDQSTNAPTSWAWTFGDGATSDQQNPSHQYTAAGNYTVNLTATNSAGSDSEEKAEYITVTAAPVVAPVADFTASTTTGVVPLFVRFTDTSTNAPTSWTWDFGDGSTSTDQNTTHTYMATGTYTAKLTATNAGGSNDATKTITVAIGTGGVAATPWPKFAADMNNSGRSGFTGPQTNTVKWIYAAGGSFRDGNPVIGQDGTIYIPNSGDSHFYAVNPNGTLRWSAVIGNAFAAPAVAADGTIYIGNYANKNLQAINPDGTAKWSYPVGSTVWGSPGIGTDGTIYIATASSNNMIYALNPDGTLKWSYKTGGLIRGSPAIGADGTIYFCNHGDYRLYALNPDGTLKWTYLTGGSLQGSPAIDDSGTIYFGSYDSKVYALNPDGTLKWSYTTGGQVRGAPAIGRDGTIYVGNNGDSKLYALNPDGTLKWSSAAGQIEGSPVIGADGTIYVGAFNTIVYAFSPDGAQKWSYTTGGYLGVSTAAIGSDGTLYVGSGNGNLYAFQDPVTTVPVASFTANTTSGTAPLAVQFTDTSTNTPTSWSWTFGDGATSTEQNPSHQYTAAGIYTVSLTATNAAGSDSEAKAGFITVTATPTPPVADFVGIPSSGTAPLTVQFSDQSTGTPTAWVWDFGDGANSTDQNPSHTYTSVGTYTVTLTATNADGSDSEEKTGYIHAVDSSQPTVILTPQSGNVPVGGTTEYTLTINSLPAGMAGYNLSVSLSDPAAAEITAFSLPAWATLNVSSSAPGDSVWFSGLDLARSVEAGATNVPLGTVSVRGDALGSSQVVVTVSEMDSDGGGLIVPSIVNGQLNVYQPVVADFSADNTTGKLPFTVHFTDLSTGDPVPTSWSWDFGDGTTSTDKNPTHTYTSGGQFTVILTASSTYSQHTVTKANYITVTRHVVTFPGCENPPLDPDLDGRYEDINGNGRLDFHDVVTLYQNMQWVRDNTGVGVEPFDFNGNGRLDYDDVVLLYYEVLAG